MLKAADVPRYKLEYDVTHLADRQVRYEMAVRDGETGQIVQKPTVTTMTGVPATVSSADPKGNLAFSIDIQPKGPARGTLSLKVKRDGRVIQESAYDYTSVPPEPHGRDDLISVSVKDASIRDLMKTFAQITGKKITVHDDVNGTVTLDLVDTPWQEALLQAAWRVRKRSLTPDEIRISK